MLMMEGSRSGGAQHRHVGPAVVVDGLYRIRSVSAVR
jgi:hypothetical protein